MIIWPCVVWLTGLSGSGKSTMAMSVHRYLSNNWAKSVTLDGDYLRNGLCSDLGFSNKDRSENIRRVGEVAKLFYGQGYVVLCPVISPFEKDRRFARSLVPEGRFVEVYVKCSITVCKRRDPKGLYKKVAAGEIEEFTGVSSPYEVPKLPEITVTTDKVVVEGCANEIIEYLGQLV